MKRTRILPLIPTLTFLAAAPLFGQDASGVTQDAQPRSEELKSPTFIKATIGPGAVVADGAEQRLGVVRDHVIDRRSGKVLFVAVGPAQDDKAQAHLVPYGRFSWDPEQQRLLLPISAEELGSMPEYDPMNLPPIGGAGLEGGAAGSGSRPDRSGEPKEAAVALPNLVSSEIFGSRIEAVRGKKFASVGNLVMEPDKGTIEFVLAAGDSSQDSPYIIPWRAMTWNDSGDDRGHFALTVAEGDLAQAPRLERGNMSRLEQQEELETIYRFYALETPMLRAGGSAPRN